MTTNSLRKYMDLLAEAEASIPVPNKQQQIQRAQDFASAMGIDLISTPLKWTAKGGVPVEIMGQPVPEKLFTDTEKKLIAAAGGAVQQAPIKPAEPSDAGAGQSSSAFSAADPRRTDQAAPTAGQAASPAGQEDPRAIQQALVDAGFDIGKHGVDGKIGPDTRAAINAAELTLGRQPTGKITVAELAGLKKATAQSALTKSLTAIEAVLAKYKIKAESLYQSVDQMVMENIKLFSTEEQFEIWRIVAEADTSDVPAYLRKGTDQFANPTPDKLGTAGASAAPAEKTRMRWDPQTKNYYTVDAKGAKTYQGGVGQKPAEPTSKLAKFGKNLAKRFGYEKGATGKAAAKAGVKVAAKGALRFLPFVGWAWLAYDVGSALYDTFTEKEFADLAPEDQAIIKANLPTILNYYKDPKLGDSLPKELSDRIRNAINGLTKLEVEMGDGTPAAKSSDPTSTTNKSPETQAKSDNITPSPITPPTSKSNAAPQQAASPTQGDEVAQIKKNAGIPVSPTRQDGLSEFSVKGIRFGMDESTVKSLMPSDFSILGVTGWKPEFDNGKLVSIGMGYGLATNILEFNWAANEKFGKSLLPKTMQDLGYYRWHVKDAVISTKTPVSNPATGKLDRDGIIWASITSKAHSDKSTAQYQEKEKQKQKDFE